MSLRSEIHAAFDDMAPSLRGLPERVVDTVLAEGPARQRRNRMLSRIRAPLSLMAAIVAIALVAVVLVGGRMIQDWNAAHDSSPAGNTSSLLAQLEARPLQVAKLQSLSDCTPGPISAHGMGTGPIYVLPGAPSFTVWGMYFHHLAYSDGNVAGPALLRAVDLLTGTRLVFVGPYAIGPVVGSDTVDGKRVQQHPEALIDTTSTAADLGPSWNSGQRHAFDWPFIVGVPAAWSGAVGWQIDAAGLTEDFVSCP